MLNWTWESEKLNNSSRAQSCPDSGELLAITVDTSSKKFTCLKTPRSDWAPTVYQTTNKRGNRHKWTSFQTEGGLYILGFLKLCCCVSASYHNGLGLVSEKGIGSVTELFSQETGPDEFSGSKLTRISILNMKQWSLQANTAVRCNEYCMIDVTYCKILNMYKTFRWDCVALLGNSLDLRQTASCQLQLL